MQPTAEINPYLFLVSENMARRKLPGGNMIFYSELRQRYNSNVFRATGLKYVAEGTEYYQVGGTKHKVQGKQFLVCNNTPDSSGMVDSKQIVKGICIDIDERVIDDAFRVLSSGNKLDIDHTGIKDGQAGYFFEHVSHAAGSTMNNRLMLLEKHLLAHQFALPFVDESWFFETAEELILGQYAQWQCANRLQFQKANTRKEIFRRLSLGRAYIDMHFMENPGIKTIAGVCNLSEFHFFRSFKDAFSITPHQYVLKKKMEHAFELLTTQCLSVAETALRLGFSDTAAFSHTFRKKYGISPAQARTVSK